MHAVVDTQLELSHVWFEQTQDSYQAVEENTHVHVAHGRDVHITTCSTYLLSINDMSSLALSDKREPIRHGVVLVSNLQLVSTIGQKGFRCPGNTILIPSVNQVHRQ